MNNEAVQTKKEKKATKATRLERVQAPNKLFYACIIWMWTKKKKRINRDTGEQTVRFM